jgi:hypothetical protein
LQFSSNFLLVSLQRMADQSTAIEKVLTGVKLAPSVKDKLKAGISDYFSDANGARARRLADSKKSAYMKQYRPIVSTITTTAGGFLAETVRRKLLGKFVSDPLLQGVGLILAGGAVNYIGFKYIPYLAGIGSGHIGLGGAIVATRFYHSEKKPDALYIAYEGTTTKAIEKAKKAAPAAAGAEK